MRIQLDHIAFGVHGVAATTALTVGVLGGFRQLNGL